MDYEFDDRKNAANMKKHGIDFDSAARIFDSRIIVCEDHRKDYGEFRYIATGQIDGVVYVVVYTVRAGIQRIISARRANRRERDAYRSSFT